MNIVQLIDTVAHRDYQSELKYLVTNEKRLDYISSLLNNIKKDGNTLILVDRISAGEKLKDLIPGSSFVKGDVT